MKVAKVLISTAVVVSMLASTALAADDVSSPTYEGDGPAVIAATDSEGNDVTPMMVTTELGTESAVTGINSYLEDAQADIDAAGKPAGLPGIENDLKDALDTLDADADVEDLTFGEVFDCSYVDEEGNVVELNGPVTITFAYEVSDEDVLIVLHNYETGEWEVIDPSKVTVDYDNGTVTVVLDNGLSPLAFVTVPKHEKKDADATATPTPTSAPKADDGTTSPQTGEHVGAYVLIIAAALAVAGVVCIKRAKNSVR
ncbi:MAG: hypothetical protein IJ869_00960 [Clostridiales bacterium]|nr:hypothetical protein [Clostridiales bacterium]